MTFISPSFHRRIIAIVLVMLGCAGGLFAQANWPSDAELAKNWTSFRGSGIGVVKADTLTDWDGATGKNILWKTPVPLAGKNSPIIWNDSIFFSGATTEVQEVFCFDAATGALRWRKAVGKPDPAKAPKIMDDTGYAAPTMTTDGRRVFAMFVTGDIVALDFTGNVVWSKALGMPDNQYGHATSLIMWQDRLIVQFDQGLEAKFNKSALLALDAATGKEIWKTPRPVANSWTSPIVVSTPAGPQIITTANPFVIAYEPKDGTELWRVKCLEGDVAPSPAYANGLVLAVMENAIGSAIKVDGKGDVSKSHVAWEIDSHLPDIVSPLITDKHAFTVETFGNVTCYDATNGKKLWEHQFDSTFHASPFIVGNVVHLIDRKGVTYRFEAAGEFKLLNQPALGEAVSATPAIVNNRMYIRGESNLYCIGVK